MLLNINTILFNVIIIYILEIKFYKVNTFILIISLSISHLITLLIINNLHNNFNNLILLIYFCFFKGNIQSSLNIIKLKNTALESQQPTPSHLIKEINYIIKNNISKKIKKLIDFGCGECNTLSKIKFKYKKIGVEYDKDIYLNAIKEINKNNYNINQILNCNILDYNFNDNCIIYIYEPLWNTNNNDVYIKLFQKLSCLNHNIDIIYVTGLLVKKLDDDFFINWNFKIIDKYKLGSLFLNRTLYYCRKYKK